MPILILGHGRSGTSLVAGICSKLGVYMGKRVHKANKQNIYGYYEDLEFMNINRHYTNLFLDMKTKEFRRRMKILTDEREEPWGLKDPNISTPNLLHEYFRLKPQIILCLRSETDSARSMTKAYGWTDASSRLLCQTRLKAIMGALEGKEYLTIDFKEKDKAEKIAKFIGLPLTKEAREHEKFV